METKVEFRGQKELEAAIKRNPALVRSETSKYLTRASAEVNRQIKTAPWRVGGSKGGAPEATGNLRQAHRTEIDLSEFQAKIYTDSSLAKYAIWVHEGTKKMAARPWMDKALSDKARDINALQDDLLKNIVSDLAT